MSTPFVWFDHRSDDSSGAVKFYETLLGWQPAAQSPPGLTALGDGAQPWGGMTAAEGVPSGWLAYVQVDDLDASADQARQLGASIVKKRARGPAGDFVVIEDPAGGIVALWTPAGGADS
jgi:predicted enzyme related to lactoylglutathione lyase